MALPREFTSRFGEVCFAYGGFGFGWWPSCIFDPRLTEGSARQTARKNLGKKHLIYFFECHETPFAVLSSSKIVPWDEGLAENYHLGKTAKACGKQRALQFQQALQAAVIEDGKPLEQRLDWNRAEDQPQLLPLPKKGKKGDAGPSSPQKTKDNEPKPQQKKEKKRNPLFCRILKKTSADDAGTNIGFVKLASTRKSTFADARKAIEKELVPGALSRTAKWKFHVTTLGPVSLTQEKSLGPLLLFLRSGIGGNATNGGSIEDPITVVILEDESKSQQSTSVKK
jgi:PWWP domain